MLRRKSIQTLLLSAVIVMVISLLAAAISLTTQKPINKSDSKPVGLAGVQVTVVSKSAANAHEATHVVQQAAGPKAKLQPVFTDTNGAFDLGTLPAGIYSLTFFMSESAKKAHSDVLIKQNIGRSANSTILASVTIEGAANGPVMKTWDFATNKATDASEMSSVQDKMHLEAGREAGGKNSPQPDITFTADGKQKVNGKVHDVSMNSIRNTR